LTVLIYTFIYLFTYFHVSLSVSGKRLKIVQQSKPE